MPHNPPPGKDEGGVDTSNGLSLPKLVATWLDYGSAYIISDMEDV